jgi:hypothetical protein
MTLAEAIEFCTVDKQPYEEFLVRLMEDQFSKAILSLFVPNAIDFVEGDNYEHNPKLVPKGELWINDEVKPNCRKYILLHEAIECRRMRNKGISYDEAHIYADKLELAWRQYDLRELISEVDRRKRANT